MSHIHMCVYNLPTPTYLYIESFIHTDTYWQYIMHIYPVLNKYSFLYCNIYVFMLICVFSYEYIHMYTIIHIYQCTTHTIWYTDENIPHTFYILLIFFKVFLRRKNVWTLMLFCWNFSLHRLTHKGFSLLFMFCGPLNKTFHSDRHLTLYLNKQTSICGWLEKGKKENT